MTKVLLSIPTYNGQIHFGTHEAIMYSSKKGVVGGTHFVKSSLLAKGFNQLWCEALNAREKGITHFAMLHADILPEARWLDKMLAVMKEKSADVLSVVMPLKQKSGLTSTGIFSDDPMRPQRFTMRQLQHLPETFTAPGLVVNTGLMLVDLSKKWVEEIRFHIVDEIRFKNGKYEAHALSEDWAFSMDASELGARIFATRAVKAVHLGEFSYPNQGAWGELETDIFNGEAKL